MFDHPFMKNVELIKGPRPDSSINNLNRVTALNFGKNQ